MKQILTATLCVAVVVLLLAPGQVLAASDTLVVYANGPALDNVIGSDTTAGGVRLHHVYRLVSTDTTYIFDGTMTFNSDVTFLGVPNPTTGKLPCIQPDVLSDNSIPGVLFTLTGKKTQATFKNLYLLGIAINNAVNYGAGQALQVSADSIRVVVDRVVFEQWSQFAIGYSGNWDKFFITNCKFRNMVTQPNQWYVGEVLRNENYLGKFPTDSVVMRYNTMLCVSGYSACPVTVALVKYFDFSHNSVIYTFKNPFFIFNLTDGKLDNNMFYGAWAGGISKTEYPWWDQLWSPEIGSIIDFDNLDSAKIAAWKPALPRRPASVTDTAAEKLRTIEVKNNVYFWPRALTDFWKAWNDTAHVDSIYTVQWMNTRTTNMFTDKVTWPGFVQSGNLNVDPGFGASIPAVLNNVAGNGVGLLNWFGKVRQGSGTTEVWGYKITQVTNAANWTPPWPLPEAADMQYSSTALRTGGTDGLPIGDPNWFGIATSVEPVPSTTPSAYALAQNYPNPFNPVTKIQFSLPATSVVTLKVYNMLGQEVATLVAGTLTAGIHEASFDALHLASGVYMYKVTAGDFVSAKKMMLLK